MIVLILVIGFLLRIINLNQSFWLDEAAQVIESIRPLSQQLDIKGDFQPPLFHLLLHFWMLLGKSESWIRLLSVLFGVFTIYILYLITQKLYTQKIALFASFLLAINPFHVYYSQESRPYALSALLGVISLYFLINKRWVYYLFSTALFLYTLYLAPFFILAEVILVFFFFNKEFKKFIISLLGSFALFVPWLPSFYTQLTIGKGLTVDLPGWSSAVSTPFLKSLPLVFTKFLLGKISIEPKIVYGAVILCLFTTFVFAVYQSINSYKKQTMQILILVVTPIISAFLFSFFLPILAPQRVLFCLPFFLPLFIAVKNQRIQYSMCAIVLLVSIFGLFEYYSKPQFQREQWRQAIASVESQRTAHSLALFAFPEAFAPWQWYSQRLIPDLGIAPKLVISDSESLDVYSTQVNQADKIFYFQYLSQLSDPQQFVPKYLNALGYYEVIVLDYPGVGFISIYEKSIAYH